MNRSNGSLSVRGASDAITVTYRNPDQMTENSVEMVVEEAPLTDAAVLLADASVRAYQADLRDWQDWCHQNKRSSLPATPDAVCTFLTQRSQSLKAATLSRRLAAISSAHRSAGYQSPTADPKVRQALKAIRRQIGTCQSQKAALITVDLRDAVTQMDTSTLIGKRNKALLLLGFAGAFRRSELVCLDVADLEPTRQGMLVTVRRSKTDQEGKGQVKPIPKGRDEDTCPVAAVEAWQKESGITSGPLFRYVDRYGTVTEKRSSGAMVAKVVKEAAQMLRLDPKKYGAHSLRAGLATSAAMEGADDRSIMAMTGHKSREMVDRYVRDGQRWKNNAATRAGL